MAGRQKAVAERLSQRDEEVRKALEQTAPGEAEPRPISLRRNLVWLAIFGALFLAFGLLVYLISNETVRVSWLRFGTLGVFRSRGSSCSRRSRWNAPWRPSAWCISRAPSPATT